MRVGTVPQRQSLVRDTSGSFALLGSVEGRVLFPEVIADGLVVRRGLLKRLQSESASSRLRHGALGLDFRDDGVVVGRGADDGGTAVVFGTGTEKGDTSDINLLDGAGERAVGLLGLEDEGVQVADDEGDGGDVVVGEILEVGRDISGKDT